jgi:hypothetical protein
MFGFGFVGIQDDDQDRDNTLKFRPTLDRLETRESPAVISFPDFYVVRSGRTLATQNTFIPGGKFGGKFRNTGVLQNDYDDQVTPPNPGSNRFLNANLITNPVDVTTGLPITTPFQFNNNGPGSFTFRAPRNFNGPVRFTYQAFNPSGTVGPITTVNIQVIGPTRRIALGADAGGEPKVLVYDSTAKFKLFEIMAYDPSFTGGVRVATADINGDNVDDIITAPGKGGGPHIRVFDGRSGALVTEFMAYEPSMTAGLNITTGDVFDIGDNREEIIVAPDAGGGPHVRVIAITETVPPVTVNEFFAYQESFRGGVRLAVGDVEGDGNQYIVTAPGKGGGPHIQVWDANEFGSPSRVREFFHTDLSYTEGLNITVGDFNGDYYDDYAIGTGSGNPIVSIRSGRDRSVFGTFVPGVQPPNPGLQGLNTGAQSTLLGNAQFNPNNSEPAANTQVNTLRPSGQLPDSLSSLNRPANPGALTNGIVGGARIGVTYANRDDVADLIVVSGPNDYPRMRIYSGGDASVLIDYTDVFGGTFFGGMFAAGHF